MVCIIDYGVGNLASISNMLKKIGVSSLITSAEQDIQQAEKIILPGVGSFDTCARKLQQSGLMQALTKRVQENKVPLLGVCVGMQLLFEKSEEGVLPGLGWIKGSVIKFDNSKLPDQTKIPHIGWRDVVAVKPTPLIQGLEMEARFYFVHSYHAQVTDTTDALLTADYGYTFVAAVERNNVMGVQFHPEKSHRFGMKLLENFSRHS